MAGGVAIDPVLAAQAPDQVSARGGETARAPPHVWLALAQPTDLRTDGLAGEAHQRETQDLLATDQRVELRDFLARANVHAVEDGRPKRPAGVVQRQQAGSDRTH